MKSNLIKEKSFQFSLKSIDLYKELIEKKEFVLSKQFLRSATSIGANVNESEAASSRKDFVYKLTITSKEARETMYWLKLIEYSNVLDFEFEEIKEQCESIIRILTSIIKTTSASIN
jgi:four helix bundle protein